MAEFTNVRQLTRLDLSDKEVCAQSRPRLSGRTVFRQHAPSQKGASCRHRRQGLTVLVRAEASSNGAARPPWAKKDCRLVLEDGSVWEGRAFGARGTRLAEVVFNTSLTGYQEILTDPSYRGQFVVYTTPHIGNVGINEGDMESSVPHCAGIIVRDLANHVSNYRSTISLPDYMEKEGLVGISDVDTRAITIRLRETGCLNGIITDDAGASVEDLVARTKEWSILGQDLIAEVTCSAPYEWRDPTGDEWEFSAAVRRHAGGTPFHIVAYDYGIKHNILRRLASFGCRITVVPASFPAEEALALNPDGIFFSNGPGDPSAAPYAVEITRQLLGQKPVFGICMGHQILGQAFGATTFKLKFGHHGGNHPIRYGKTGRIEISAQNHNYAVDPATLPPEVETTHVNLNDGTCAGLLCGTRRAMAIQYHPEASPGPHDADVCFEQYIEMLRAERDGNGAGGGSSAASKLPAAVAAEAIPA